MATLHAITPTALVTALLSPAPVHLTDGLGLYLVTNGGARRGFWRYEYKSPTTGKRTKLSLGEVFLNPTTKPVAKVSETVGGVTLAAVRAEHARVRDQIKAGTDPKADRDSTREATRSEQEAADAARKEAARRAAAGLPQAGTFKDWADRYHAYRMTLGQNADSYLNEFRWTMEKHVHPFIGDKLIGDVTSMDIAALDERTADIKHARLKARRFVRSVFNWAMLPKNGHAVRSNPVYEDADLFIGLESTPRASVVTGDNMTAEDMEKAVQRLVRAIDGYTPPKRIDTLKNALWLQCLTFQRPGQIARAQKDQFDLDKGTWVAPPEILKGRTSWKNSGKAQSHLVYLAPAAVRMLREQFAAFPDSPYVFPGQGKARGSHMSPTSVNRLLHVIGYGGEHTAHGFRAMGRTVGAEVLGIDEIVLEKILAHRAALLTQGEQSGKVVRMARDGGMPGVYDRTQYLDARQMAAVMWADFIEGLRADPEPQQIAA